MNKKKEDLKKSQARKISIKEGSAWSLMEGFGSRYITPYALYLGASNSQIGFLSSFPGLLGNIFQIPALKLFRNKNNTRKKIVFNFVFLQALLWIPIIAIGFLYFFDFINAKLASNLLIISYTAIVIAGTSASSAWNSWMKDIIIKNNGQYFGRRSRIIHLVVILSMLIAGIILNFFGKEDAFKGFMIIFFIAFIGRMISSYFIKKIYEPKFQYKESSYFTLRQFIKKMFYNNFGRFVIFVSLMSFATAIAGPFFAVYMLKDLNFNYINYIFITITSIISLILFMPFWGKFGDKFGTMKAIRITSFFIPFVPLLWFFSIYIHNQILLTVYLIIAEFISGFAWAGFNLSSSNFVYDSVTKEKIAFCFAYFNILNAFGAFIGAALGGFISSKSDIFGIKSLLIIFILSAIMRFVVAIVMVPVLKEVREVKDFNVPSHIIKRLELVEHMSLMPIEKFIKRE